MPLFFFFLLFSSFFSLKLLPRRIIVVHVVILLYIETCNARGRANSTGNRSRQDSFFLLPRSIGPFKNKDESRRHRRAYGGRSRGQWLIKDGAVFLPRVEGRVALLARRNEISATSIARGATDIVPVANPRRPAWNIAPTQQWALHEFDPLSSATSPPHFENIPVYPFGIIRKFMIQATRSTSFVENCKIS